MCDHSVTVATDSYIANFSCMPGWRPENSSLLFNCITKESIVTVHVIIMYMLVCVQ